MVMRLLQSLVLLLLLLWAVFVGRARGGPEKSISKSAQLETSSSNGSSMDTGNSTAQGDHGVSVLTSLPIVTWKWHHVEEPYLVALWVLVCWLCKFVLELNNKLTKMVPESALLILIGFVLGGIIWAADKAPTFYLTPRTFFFFLLPQIILDSGYFMPNKLFFGNMGAILTYAVIGTVWNAVAVGISLWGVHMGGAMGNLDIDILQYMLFGSLLSAVDPVAVIAVFEEVHVNEVLFILVFGESLLNDGVTVVLYNVCDAFVTLGGDKINAAEIVKGIISFFVVAFGGSLVGVAFAILLSLLTRFTKNIQIIEPGFIFVLGYLSYLTAEMLSLSSILAITFCGICSQKYINANMDERSVTTVKHAMKVFANGSETMIFVFLGISAIDPKIWVWNTAFILLTLLFVFVYRIIGTFSLTWILNRYRLVPLEFIDQVIMSYGGLRGGVAYGLVFLLDDKKIKEKNVMITATLLVVYFTVILQGVTMKPLVTWLKVKRSLASSGEIHLIEKLQNRAFDHILIAVEDISGQIGHNYMRDKWNQFEEKWIRPILMKPSARKSQDYIFDVFHQLNLKDAVNYVKEGERRGSLVFVRSDSDANVDFKKKFDSDYSDIMQDIKPGMSNAGFDDIPVSSILQDNLPSVSLDIHDLEMRRKNLTEDVNTHHLLQTSLYRARKQHRHRYSRSHIEINKDENEVQEIFQRTMRSRLESFKSTKMGVTQNKTIKHPKKDQKMPNGKNKAYTFEDGDFEFSEAESVHGSEASGFSVSEGGIAMRVSFRSGGGIDNPVFKPDGDLVAPKQTPPWVAEGQVESSVAPSQRAQLRLPWSPSNLRRLAPLRISTRSTDSFVLADTPTTEGEQHPPTQQGGPNQ